MGAGAAIGAVTGGLGLGAGFLEAKGIEAQAEFEARQSEFNAKLARLNAEDAINRGEKLAAKVRRQARQTIGTQRAAFAAQGIAIDAADESTGQLQTDVEIFAALDEAEARDNASKEAFAYEMDAVQMESQAQFARAQGKFRSGLTVLKAGAGAFGSIAGGHLSDLKANRSEIIGSSDGGPEFTEDADRYSGGFDTALDEIGGSPLESAIRGLGTLAKPQVSGTARSFRINSRRRRRTLTTNR